MDAASYFFIHSMHHQTGCVLPADTWLLLFALSLVSLAGVSSLIPNWGRRQGLGSCRFQPRFNEIPVKLPIRKLCVTCTSQGAGRAGRGTLELFYEVFPS